MTTLVIARTTQRARAIMDQLDTTKALAASPRSIAQGAGRGLVVDTILVDDSIWPLDDRTLEALGPHQASVKPIAA